MKLNNARVVLTGATGGIGSHIARELSAKGAHVLLVGRRADALKQLQQELQQDNCICSYVVTDLTSHTGRQILADQATEQLGNIDILINNAGISSYSLFSEEDPEAIEHMYKTNLIAPITLTRLVLPQMIKQGHGQIVNVGSIFGSIGFACFANYSSSKFALRGFSEALRRELEDDGITVTYVAPRSVRTPINSPAVYRMAEAVKMTMDEPEAVAKQLVAAIEQDRKDVYLGWPEKLFVRINGLLPRLVDAALRAKNKIMRNILRQT